MMHVQVMEADSRVFVRQLHTVCCSQHQGWVDAK